MERITQEPIILWDFDGTLVDTAALWRMSEYAFLRARGLEWNDEASRRLIGGNLDLARDVMAEVTGVLFTAETLRDELPRNVMGALQTRVPWMPGVERLLAEQHAAGVRSALVTSSYSEMVTVALASLPFPPFEVIISREDVTRPKPDPEPYALALRRLGATNDCALAIEDSVSGVMSALDAGCQVVVVGEHAPDPRLERPRVFHLSSLGSTTLSALLSLASVG